LIDTKKGRPMRTGARIVAATACAAALLGACNRGGGGGGEVAGEHQTEAHVDSARAQDHQLRDAGVTVDTQSIDTGTARSTPVEDN
jgi:hypothetical protein